MIGSVTLALPKGRLAEDAAKLFAKAGYDLAPVFGDHRKLVVEAAGLRVLILRNSDIATYVGHGAADIGIAGSDVLDEAGRDLYEPLDLGIGRCRMIVAQRADQPPIDPQLHLRIASKYPRTTTRYLQAKGITAEVIELSGAIELGPLTGLCEQIVDITQTGETLRQNGLVEVATIAQVTAKLVVNPARLKLDERIGVLIDAIERVI